MTKEQFHVQLYLLLQNIIEGESLVAPRLATELAKYCEKNSPSPKSEEGIPTLLLRFRYEAFDVAEYGDKSQYNCGNPR